MDSHSIVINNSEPLNNFLKTMFLVEGLESLCLSELVKYVFSLRF